MKLNGKMDLFLLHLIYIYIYIHILYYLAKVYFFVPKLEQYIFNLSLKVQDILTIFIKTLFFIVCLFLLTNLYIKIVRAIITVQKPFSNCSQNRSYVP